MLYSIQKPDLDERTKCGSLWMRIRNIAYNNVGKKLKREKDGERILLK
jgi:hypothetical protein